jgi:hypothetical protein
MTNEAYQSINRLTQLWPDNKQICPEPEERVQ